MYQNVLLYQDWAYERTGKNIMISETGRVAERYLMKLLIKECAEDADQEVVYSAENKIEEPSLEKL